MAIEGVWQADEADLVAARFQALLSQISKQHHDDVTTLRTQNGRLQEQLRFIGRESGDETAQPLPPATNPPYLKMESVAELDTDAEPSQVTEQRAESIGSQLRPETTEQSSSLENATRPDISEQLAKNFECPINHEKENEARIRHDSITSTDGASSLESVQSSFSEPAHRVLEPRQCARLSDDIDFCQPQENGMEPLLSMETTPEVGYTNQSTTITIESAFDQFPINSPPLRSSQHIAFAMRPQQTRHNSLITSRQWSKETTQSCSKQKSVGNFELFSDWTRVERTTIVQVDDKMVVEAGNQKLLKKKAGSNLGWGSSSRLWKYRDFSGSQHDTCVIDPSCDIRMLWDVSGMFLISWDMITVPLMVFEPEEHWLTTFMEFVTLIYWTCDIFWSLTTGYFKDGKLITSRKKIFKHYCKTWLAIDCIVVVPDWVMTSMGSTSNVGKLGRLLKAARVVRVLRLLRLLKLRRLVNELYDRIASELMFIAVDLVKMITSILVLNHIVACSWYGVGVLSRMSHHRNWLENVGMYPVIHGDLGWKYSTSLHWSITQFTPASMDVYATNTGERIFSVFILFWAMVMLSTVISSVNVAMTSIRNMSGDRTKQFWMLRRYLKQRNSSNELTNRIIKYVEHKVQTKFSILPPGKVQYLHHLSEQLADQLSFETNAPMLRVHPFYRVLGSDLPTVVYRLCTEAVKCHDYAVDDVVFNDAQRSLSMYFVRLGVFRYRNICWLDQKKFFSEQALWVTWHHRGDLVNCDDVGELLGVNSQQFGKLLRANPKTWDFALHYGRSFVECINSIDQTLLTDITNLNPQETDIMEVSGNEGCEALPLHAWSERGSEG